MRTPREYLVGFQARLHQRRVERAWRNATPVQQMNAMIDILHRSPEARRLFRDALYGKTHQARKPRL